MIPHPLRVWAVGLAVAAFFVWCQPLPAQDTPKYPDPLPRGDAKQEPGIEVSYRPRVVVATRAESVEERGRDIHQRSAVVIRQHGAGGRKSPRKTHRSDDDRWKPGRGPGAVPKS